MSANFVQFEDDKKLKIISVFGNAQDPGVYPNQGVVEEDDPLWLEYLAALPDVLRNQIPASN